MELRLRGREGVSELLSSAGKAGGLVYSQDKLRRLPILCPLSLPFFVRGRKPHALESWVPFGDAEPGLGEPGEASDDDDGVDEEGEEEGVVADPFGCGLGV